MTVNFCDNAVAQAAQEQHLPQVVETNPVAGAITMLAKAGMVLAGSTQVATRHSRTLNIQLAADPNGQQPAIGSHCEPQYLRPETGTWRCSDPGQFAGRTAWRICVRGICIRRT